MAAGQKVCFAQVGANLVNAHTGARETLKPARIRGVVSQGMICSQLELGLGEDHTGIIVLPGDAPVGTPLDDYLGDTILDLEVTPNRLDCLSILGVAHETAALTGKTVTHPEVSYPEEGPPLDRQISIRIDDPDLCRRYTASLISGVTIGPSPRWLQDRLTKTGLRPINNVVDVTNYVMLEYNQPLHAFDYDRLQDRTVVVRRARPGESLTTLDGVERRLDPDVLVIADGRDPIGIGGVIGGARSEIGPATSNVLLESATFDGYNNRRTAQKFGLHTEATLRFEKGLRPQLAPIALRRATQLIRETAGGRVSPGIVDVFPDQQYLPQTVGLTSARLRKVLGMDVDLDTVERVLGSLGLETRRLGPDRLEADVPYWRNDITIEDDLVEEVVRIIGYDAVPVTMLATPIPSLQQSRDRRVTDRVKDALAALGMQEVINYPLVSREDLAKAAWEGPAKDALRVANPMNAAEDCLRPTLRPSLLASLAANQGEGTGPLRLFEVGRVFLPRPHDLPEERETASGIMAGQRRPPSWLEAGPESGGSLDFYDAKGVVVGLLEQLGTAASLRTRRATLLPSRASRLGQAGRPGCRRRGRGRRVRPGQIRPDGQTGLLLRARPGRPAARPARVRSPVLFYIPIPGGHARPGLGAALPRLRGCRAGHHCPPPPGGAGGTFRSLHRGKRPRRRQVFGLSGIFPGARPHPDQRGGGPLSSGAPGQLGAERPRQRCGARPRPRRQANAAAPVPGGQSQRNAMTTRVSHHAGSHEHGHRHVEQDMLSVEQAYQRIMAGFRPLEPEETPLLEALGRVLAADVRSPLDLPPTANSGMDGYALRWEDIQDASPETPRVLSVIGVVAAGQVPSQTVTPGKAVRIMTGASLPRRGRHSGALRGNRRGAAQGGGSTPGRGGGHGRPPPRLQRAPRGRGCTPGPACPGIGDSGAGRGGGSAGLLGHGDRPGGPASGGGRVGHWRRADAARTAPGRRQNLRQQQLQHGRLGHPLRGHPQDAGHRPGQHGGPPRQAGSRVGSGLDRYVGRRVQGRLRHRKGSPDPEGRDELLVGAHAAGQAPGLRPRQGSGGNPVPLLGLPGNPVSAMVAFEMFARPAILTMLGRTRLPRPAVEGVLTAPIFNADGRRVYARVEVERRNGSYYATPCGPQGSNILTSMSRANGLAICPENLSTKRAGERVDIIMLDWNEEVEV